jgi:H+-transporting ATPase
MSAPAGTEEGAHYNEKDNLDQKEEHPAAPPAKEEDEEEDEDIDALIEELESQDGAIDDDEEEVQAGGARNVPEELLQTSTRTGLNSADVTTRRKKYGLNQMKEEKENLILKFLGFFIGPIQFVMEVRASRVADINHVAPTRSITFLLTSPAGCGCPCCWSSRLGRFWCHLRPIAS